MENKRSSWGSNLGFLMAAVGSAVGLLHSTSATNAEILDDLLTKWADMGYRFGTLDELFDAA